MISLQRIKKVQTLYLKRLIDNRAFQISTPCVLELPDGLVHVVGEPQEELDPSYIWDLGQKFEVLKIESL